MKANIKKIGKKTYLELPESAQARLGISNGQDVYLAEVDTGLVLTSNQAIAEVLRPVLTIDSRPNRYCS